MYTGAELGAALKAAMDKKGVKQAAVARHFEIAQPSVSEWIKFGRIGKQHIPKLVAYFADVVGVEHWGLPAAWGQSASSEEETAWLEALRDLKEPESRRKLITYARVLRDQEEWGKPSSEELAATRAVTDRSPGLPPAPKPAEAAPRRAAAPRGAGPKATAKPGQQ